MAFRPEFYERALFPFPFCSALSSLEFFATIRVQLLQQCQRNVFTVNVDFFRTIIVCVNLDSFWALFFDSRDHCGWVFMDTDV